ncbi:hypothetical protein D1007_29248 [Hordeum vulgare]|nr:hypothetical protein D1007_29248 [Hordeum vulgare]
MLTVQLERDLELQAGNFVGDYHIEDATAILFLCSPLDAYSKEALEPINQPISMEGTADKANGATHANGPAGEQCKYGAAALMQVWRRRSLPIPGEKSG